MSLNFNDWCTLCGNSEFVVKVEDSSDAKNIIQQILQVNFNSFPAKLKVCEKCYSFINEIQIFIKKCKKSLEMFQKICETPDNTDQNFLDQIRRDYGLPGSENPLPESSISNDVDSKLIPLVLKYEAFEDEGEGNHQEEALLEEQKEEHLKKRKYTFINRKKKEVPQGESSEKKKPAEEDSVFDYSCHICKKDLKTMHFLVQHCKKYHDCTPEVNCVCGTILRSTNNVLVHKKKHNLRKNVVKCPFCRYTFVSQANLDKHVNKLHGENEKNYICTHCGNSYKDKWLFREHTKTHLPEELKRKFRCDLCPQRYRCKAYLRVHMDTIHLKKISFTCDTCGKQFACQANYRSHLKVHLTTRNYGCSECSAKFKTAQSLRIHRNTHFGKVYQCTECPKNFHSASLLYSHKFTHSKERPHVCPHCPKDFVRIEHLRIHINVHTGDKPFKCKYCGRGFANNSNLRKHKLRDHPTEVARDELKKKQEIQLAMFGGIE